MVSRAPNRTRPTERRPVGWRPSWRIRRSRRRTIRETPARQRRATRDAAPNRTRHSIPFGQRDGENAPFVDALRDFAKARVFHELVHFSLRTPAHHPWRAAAMTGERACDQFELWMPGLVRIYDVAARGYRIGKTGERRLDRRIIGEQFVQTRYDADGRARRDGGEACAIERVAANESNDLLQTLGADQCAALIHVEIVVIA